MRDERPNCRIQGSGRRCRRFRHLRYKPSEPGHTAGFQLFDLLTIAIETFPTAPLPNRRKLLRAASPRWDYIDADRFGLPER